MAFYLLKAGIYCFESHFDQKFSIKKVLDLKYFLESSLMIEPDILIANASVI